MKKSVLSSILMILCIITLAQAPESFNYQAVVRDASNNPITNQAVSFRISILKGSVSGSEEYVETHVTSTTSLGLVTLTVGGGSIESGVFSNIDWGADNYFLKVECDPAGGTSYVEMGITQLLSVPYAMYSKIAGETTETDPVFTSWDKDYEDLVNQPTAISDFTMNANSQNITSLANPQNAQDAATKAYVDILLEKVEYLESLVGVEEPVTDSDGNTYLTIRIGTQVWAIENLKTTKYSNGTSIPLITDATDWSSLTTPGYCWYDNDEVAYGDTYGALYNWYTVNTGNLCPSGWHVPTYDEWVVLYYFIATNGGKLKEVGTEHWNSPNTGATNETFFTALPGGIRMMSGIFAYIQLDGYWWTSVSSAVARLNYSSSSLSVDGGYANNFGFSVRCIKD